MIYYIISQENSNTTSWSPSPVGFNKIESIDIIQIRIWVSKPCFRDSNHWKFKSRFCKHISKTTYLSMINFSVYILACFVFSNLQIYWRRCLHLLAAIIIHHAFIVDKHPSGLLFIDIYIYLLRSLFIIIFIVDKHPSGLLSRIEECNDLIWYVMRRHIENDGERWSVLISVTCIQLVYAEKCTRIQLTMFYITFLIAFHVSL